MATTAINAGNLSLLDNVKRTDPSGRIAPIVELLTQKSALMQDAVWQEGNLATGHRFTSRTALPSIYFRRYNEGVDASKSHTDQIDETCGMLEAHSIVDCELAKLNGNQAAFRASEDVAFMSAIKNKVESAFFYSSTKTAPEEIMGLSPRLDSKSGPYKEQIIDSGISASGSDQTSIWFIVWGTDSVFAIYPKGSTGGLEPHDMGEQMVLDANNRRFRAFETVWNWKFGLCVRDARQVARVVNIDTSAVGDTGMGLIQAMIKAYHQLYDPSAGRLAIYANRKVATQLHLQALDSVKNATLSIANIEGRPITTFMGAPIRITDALLNSEAVVS